MTLDLSLIGLLQVAALLYGMHVVWMGRPAVLAFERDRLTVAAANEIEQDDLGKAPEGLRVLPSFGVLNVATKTPKNNKDFFQGVEMSLAGVSPAMRPSLWEPLANQVAEMRDRAQPLSQLIEKNPNQAHLLVKAAEASGYKVAELMYLPLTSSKTRDWIALLSPSMQMVGHAPVDGF